MCKVQASEPHCAHSNLAGDLTVVPSVPYPAIHCSLISIVFSVIIIRFKVSSNMSTAIKVGQSPCGFPACLLRRQIVLSRGSILQLCISELFRRRISLIWSGMLCKIPAWLLEGIQHIPKQIKETRPRDSFVSQVTPSEYLPGCKLLSLLGVPRLQLGLVAAETIQART